MGLRAGLDGCGKSCPLRDWTVQPVATAEIRVKVHTLCNMPAGTVGVEWGERSSTRPGRFTTGKETQYPLQKTPGGSQGGLDRVRSQNSQDCCESPFMLRYSGQYCENVGYVKSICTSKSVS